MSHFIGIDLGTTNSVVASFDGEQIKVYDSPEQNKATPSAILYDKRGNKRVGPRAYDAAAMDPGSAAVGFKRLMGSSTPIRLPSVNLVLTPEQCSAEVLRVLFGYLPEEMRNDPDTGTVITVPAAFDQMQKDATLRAAELAGIGKVAIMQEPVAAVMNVMRHRKSDGTFLVYDLGGGTLDIAVAESLGGHVNLMANGGIAMCGGRDFDRLLLERVVAGWLKETFDLPAQFMQDPAYKNLLSRGLWATERAKIELSAREESRVSLSEEEVRLRDRTGAEIYFDVPLRREMLDQLAAPKIDASIEAAKQTLSQAGLAPGDIERIVFVGGPTQYKPFRDRIVAGLGVPGSTEVNPMTAVAEGAAVFAESIDWSSKKRGRKSGRGTVSAGGAMQILFSFPSRTPDIRARVSVQLGGEPISGAEFQVDCVDTGWSSGRIALRDAANVEVALAKAGENNFKVFLFDAAGGPIALENNRIVISRVAATVDGIPASHSLGIEVLEKVGGRSTLDWLVRAGDPLPKKGKKTFKVSESLRSGSPGEIAFKMWEGDILDPITSNRFVGVFKIKGSDLESGTIAAGAELTCEYEIADSGNATLEVSVPSIRAVFRAGQNYYSRQEGLIDFSAAAVQVAQDATRTQARIDDIAKSIDDPKLEEARKKLDGAAAIRPGETDPEKSKQAREDVLEAQKLIAAVRKGHLREIRKNDLDGLQAFFEKHVKEFARPAEVTAVENLFRTAARAIERDDRDFENLVDEARGRNFDILWRQDWFIVERFKTAAANPAAHTDRVGFAEAVALGEQALKTGDIDRLRDVVRALRRLQTSITSEDDMLAPVNIVRG